MKPYLPLEPAASTLGVPRTWLRREADAGRIPCLRIGRRRLFDVESVREALRNRAASSVEEKSA